MLVALMGPIPLVLCGHRQLNLYWQPLNPGLMAVWAWPGEARDTDLLVSTGRETLSTT